MSFTKTFTPPTKPLFKIGDVIFRIKVKEHARLIIDITHDCYITDNGPIPISSQSSYRVLPNKFTKLSEDLSDLERRAEEYSWVGDLFDIKAAYIRGALDERSRLSWFSTKDKLPIYGEPILIKLRDCRIFAACFTVQDVFDADFKTFEINEVTNWRPLCP